MPALCRHPSARNIEPVEVGGPLLGSVEQVRRLPWTKFTASQCLQEFVESFIVDYDPFTDVAKVPSVQFDSANVMQVPC